MRFAYWIGVVLLGVLFAKSTLIVTGHNQSTAKLQSYLSESYGDVTTMASNSAPMLVKDGERAYDHVLLLTASTPWAKDLGKFMNVGGNVVWTLDGKIDAASRAALNDIGRDIDGEPKPVIDFFMNKDEDSTMVRCNVANSLILDAKKSHFYSGIPHKLHKSNPLVFPILTASATAANTNGGALGRDNVLVSGMVGRNDARSVVSGQVDAFLDESFDGALVHRLCSWAFRKASVQRIDSITPKILNEGVSYFRIRDMFEVEVCLSQVQTTQDGERWVPFLPADAQLELTMMSATLRAPLIPNVAIGCLSTGPIQLPDRYGAYSLMLRYQRHGLTHLVRKQPMTVLPYRYDMVGRWEAVLWPYYAGWISQMVFSLFVVVPVLVWSIQHEKVQGKSSKKGKSN